MTRKIDKSKIDEQQVGHLLSLMQKGSEEEKKALSSFMQRNIIPFHLCSLEKSKNLLIREYTESRKKKLYTLKKSLEEEFSKRLDVPLEDLEEFGEAAEKEFQYYKKESKAVINGTADECYIDSTEAIELVRYNVYLALTSPSSYIRSLAELMVKKKPRKKKK